MERSEHLNELAMALMAFQAEVPAIPKTSDNPFFKSKYADLADVKAIADPIATKHELCVTQWPSSNERGDSLITLLLHSSGQFILSEMDLHPVKTDPQAQGSALTYGRRYAYMAALGLVADLDDDGNAASQGAQQNRQSRPQRKQQTKQQQPQKQADPETGEITENMTKFMISEVASAQRPAVMALLAEMDVNLSKVPASRKAEVEKLIAEHAGAAS